MKPIVVKTPKGWFILYDDPALSTNRGPFPTKEEAFQALGATR